LHWGVDIMPLMDHGGRPPTGDACSHDAALQAFRAAFFPWINDHAHDWARNLRLHASERCASEDSMNWKGSSRRLSQAKIAHASSRDPNEPPK
jgi:hypothetical protein